MDGLRTAPERSTRQKGSALVLVGSLDRRIVPALRLIARLVDVELRALHVSVDSEQTRLLARDWLALDLPWLPLHIREATSTTFVSAVRQAVDAEADRVGEVLVILPEAEYERWWHALLHRQSARRIARALDSNGRVTTVMVPFVVRTPGHISRCRLMRDAR